MITSVDQRLFGRLVQALDLHGSALRLGKVEVFGAHPFLAEVVQPFDQHARISLIGVLNRPRHADSIPTKVRVPCRHKIARRKPLGSCGPSRSILHLLLHQRAGIARQRRNTSMCICGCQPDRHVTKDNMLRDSGTRKINPKSGVKNILWERVPTNDNQPQSAAA